MTYFSAAEVVSFWEALAPYWNRKPGLIKRPFTRPFVDQREFLGLLKKWAEDVRHGRKPLEVAKFDADAMPAADNESLAECERHITERWPRDWYLYLPDGVQVYEGAIWERAVELIAPAIRSEGALPSGGMMLELFYGHYQATPTGIHLDSSDNLAFIARGPKRMLFWPGDRFTSKFASPAKDPSLQLSLIGRYSEHLDDAIVIDADEGDVIYWPKEYWHVGASGGNWSGMLTLPMWWSARPSSLAKAMLGRLLDLQGDSPQPYSVNMDDLASAALEVPASLQDMISQVKTQVNARLDLTSQVAWAKFVTAYGFMTPPGLVEAPPITEATKVRVKHPIVCVPLGQAMAVVGCGHSALTKCTELSTIVRRLQVGSEHTVRDLSQQVPDHNPELLKLISDLMTSRALEVC